VSNEIRATFGLTYANGGMADTIASATTNIDQTTLAFYSSTVFGGTSEEDLSVGDITAANGCWVYIKNLDSTNFVKFGPKSAGAMVEFGRVRAGKFAFFFLAEAAVLRWVADTAQCKVLVKLFEK
jgi:hypothetical protein